MAKVSRTWLVKRCAEFEPLDRIEAVPPSTRGIYALLNRSAQGKFDVVYIGMAPKSGIRGRLKSHAKSVHKKASWTHFTIFEVHDNIQPGQVAELEGLFREIYRKDSKTNQLNKQRRYGPIHRLMRDGWLDEAIAVPDET